MRINLFLDLELKTNLGKILGINSLVKNKLVNSTNTVAKSVIKINSKV